MGLVGTAHEAGHLTETDFHYLEWHDEQDEQRCEDVKDLGKQAKFARYRNWLYFDSDGFDMDVALEDKEADSLARSRDYVESSTYRDSRSAGLLETAPAEEDRALHGLQESRRKFSKSRRKAYKMGHLLYEGRIATTTQDMFGAAAAAAAATATATATTTHCHHHRRPRLLFPVRGAPAADQGERHDNMRYKLGALAECVSGSEGKA
jgi:hypothetical protein